MLFSYMQQTQKFIRDGSQQLIDPQDIIDYVNRARREISMRAEIIRVVPPVSENIASIAVTAQGAAYTSPVVTITPPDFPAGTPSNPNGLQATATATVVGGHITAIVITNPGAGYFQPIVTITDPIGSGAVAVATTSPILTVNEGQEQYLFSSFPLSSFQGVGSVFAVKSVSIIYSNYRYSLPIYSFSTYQAKIRNYPFQYQWVPTIGTQFGQGTNGSLFLYPIASQTYQMECDCLCLPSDLTSDTDFEAMPGPWTDGVPYMAAHLAFIEMQNFNSAKMMLELYDRQVGIYSRSARPGRVINPYGRF